MRRSTILFCLFVFVSMTRLVQAQTSPLVTGGMAPKLLNNDAQENPVALVERLTVELRTVRFELLKQEHEKLLSKISQLLTDVQQVDTDRQGLQAQEQAFNQQLALLDQRLGEPTLVLEQRLEIQAARTELAGNGLSRFSMEHQRIVHREAEVMTQLEETQQRRQEFVERAREIVRATQIQAENASENLSSLLKQLSGELEKMKFDLKMQ